MRSETWTIGDLARLSGVTSRTLRHYDAIGLLAPVDVGAGGRRLYGRDELLRLQQILVLRELDVDLPTVARVLAADGEHGVRAGLLREHHARLVAERDRFDRLAATVASTLESLEGGHDMAAKDLYAGFDNSQYDAEARERWGDEAVDRSNQAWAGLGADGQAAHHRESQAIGEGLAACLAEGLAPDDERTQGLVARHFAQIATFWTPNRESYRGLGQMYVDDERFTATYDAFAPGLAVYLRDAIDVWAERLPSGT
ncbi:MerR family transcriptional regulator [Cellulomonas sp. NS3]|uniref:MerR family transcriptional regulator n=1 Tax=Cellulomonas sp. NS3 TaxID=2973977 RepID=UPI002162BEBF|nr:MerR family transcriptional regulator [Cellulomonas sp. NS3]